MWKEIEGFNARYIIDENGNVRNTELGIDMRPYISNKGYKIIDLSINGTKKKMLIHRLVAIYFVPNPNNFPIVLHKDNNKLNCNYLNLVWGTYSENNSQAYNDGISSIPIPENRKVYEIYDPNTGVIIDHFFGVNEFIIKTNINYSMSAVRNWIARNDFITDGTYRGYKIRRSNAECPIKFLEKRSKIISLPESRAPSLWEQKNTSPMY